ncbi:transposase [Phaeobacter sp. 22II1-1F12B]|uniref:IS110 family transposase n=1 Tax=Phaeobacter sp. 22II1-1F12B TaxID=1317111 RepID=UPI000B521495|nr:transposase [Phaeobacter sp. 22II1-1F12B]
MDHNDTIEPKTFVAIELSKRSWVIGIAKPDRDKPSIYRLTGGDKLGLLARLRRTSDAKDMVLCFEAGHDGFWLARFLQAEGYDVRVLDPASLQVNRRARRVKTDRIDALAMLRALAAVYRGERQVCAQVRVLTVAEEDARRSHRERDRLIHERTAHVNRIKGLRTQGQGARIRRIMLIALARKLAIALWRYVETGVLPEGATLSAKAA